MAIDFGSALSNFGGGFGSVGGSILNRLMTGGVLVGIVLLLAAFLVAFYFILRYYRQFNIRIRMRTRRSTGIDGNPIYKVYYTKGGILTKRKDKRSYFRVLSDRVDLAVPPFEAFQILANGTNEIEMIQDSEGVYSYIIPGKIESGYLIKDGKLVPTAVQGAKRINSVSEYWGILRKRDNRKLFMTDTFKMQLLFAGILFLMVCAVIFFTYIWLDKAPAVIQAAKEVADSLKEAAKALGNCQAVTTPA